MNLEMNSTFLSGFEKKLKKLAGWFAIISAISLAVMMLVTLIDVLGRWLFTKPLFGSYELVGILLIIAGPFSMAITQINKRHITIQLLVDLFPLGWKKLFYSFGLLVDLFIFGMMTIGGFVLSSIYWQRGTEAVSEELGIGLIYLSICFSIACLLYTTIIFVHFTQSIHLLVRQKR